MESYFNSPPLSLRFTLFGFKPIGSNYPRDDDVAGGSLSTLSAFSASDISFSFINACLSTF